jgi:hypothetical protein
MIKPYELRVDDGYPCEIALVIGFRQSPQA